MDYDVIILGGGTYGCAIAYELSKYSLNIALIEKEYDIVTEIDTINSAIVYDGLQARSDLIASLEVEGNRAIYDICKKFNISLESKNSIFIAYSEGGRKELIRKFNKAKERGIYNIEIIDGKTAMDMESTIKKEPLMGILSRNTAIVSPYDFAIALGEVAAQNGVNFRFAETVLNISKVSKEFLITTTKGKFKSKIVINTIPDKNYDLDNELREEDFIRHRKWLSYFTVDTHKEPKNIIRAYEDNIKTLVVPTKHNVLAGAITDEEMDTVTANHQVKKLIAGLRTQHITSFLSDSYYSDEIILDQSKEEEAYIKISGKNYGELTMTPAIARLVKERVLNIIKCTEKKDFIDKRREVYRFTDLSDEERNELIKIDKRYGKVVCLCNLVTEGEIIDSIRRPLGARTVEGVKRRTGAMIGTCKGSSCLNRVVSILARELDVNVADIVRESQGSNILNGRMKEFEEI
ncbi:FAD-dependent oxidoreductase [Clostridium bornimense]|uniref:NAD(P)/FAD-dependent oxidoreductase n=1 Tax=Clostridium bornimense TaxID=1216932 RepID=UPI001C0F3E8A|nr:FAD-dependent oxidoreductase [Clostridium bornimense]MBU5317060.1 FAD-dependent oxidoreductase [Clostridium bornimense]